MTHGEQRYFTREHLEAHRGRAPASLVELVVHCLELVSQMADRDVPFRFKGGNSLLVMLEDPRRFSIDIDINTTATKEDLIGLMEDVAASCERFGTLEVRQHKTKPWLPMISFNLFFDSLYQGPGEAFVMMDAVLQEVRYPGVRVPVRCGEIYASDRTVEVATPEGLLGDKLLTLGVNTLGIPCGKGKGAQRLKHVFDCGLLAGRDPDIAAVRESLLACIPAENEIQRSSHALPEIVDDTIDFCTLTKGLDAPPDPATLEEGSALWEIATGYEPFREHVFGTDYTWAMLNEDFARVAELIGRCR